MSKTVIVTLDAYHALIDYCNKRETFNQNTFAMMMKNHIKNYNALSHAEQGELAHLLAARLRSANTE